MKQALLLIDLQNDFMPAGPLGVRGGDEIIPTINALQAQCDFIVATQDWHPSNHGSFASNHPSKKPGEMIDLAGIPQILWPAHCIQATPGADFVSTLDCTRFKKVIQKGCDPLLDSYSGFFDNDRRHATELHAFLQAHGIQRLMLAGLATDYCVKFTALDALFLGYQVSLGVDACRAVNLHAHDGADALALLVSHGVTLTRATAVGAGL